MLWVTKRSQPREYLEERCSGEVRLCTVCLRRRKTSSGLRPRELGGEEDRGQAGARSGHGRDVEFCCQGIHKCWQYMKRCFIRGELDCDAMNYSSSCICKYELSTSSGLGTTPGCRDAEMSKSQNLASDAPRPQERETPALAPTPAYSHWRKPPTKVWEILAPVPALPSPQCPQKFVDTGWISIQFRIVSPPSFLL